MDKVFEQLKKHLEKMAMQHTLRIRSSKSTYPVPLLLDNYIKIKNVYNLKPETNSVLFGYNNFWQLDANMDYFAMHSSSPFIHLWYIAILMQFELIFPFIYIILIVDFRVNEYTKK